MHNDNSIKNALENKNYSFSSYWGKNSFVSTDVVVEDDVVDLKVPNGKGTKESIEG